MYSGWILCRELRRNKIEQACWGMKYVKYLWGCLQQKGALYQIAIISFHFISLHCTNILDTDELWSSNLSLPAKLTVISQFQRGSQDTVATHSQYGHLQYVIIKHSVCGRCKDTRCKLRRNFTRPTSLVKSIVKQDRQWCNGIPWMIFDPYLPSLWNKQCYNSCLYIPPKMNNPW